MFWLQLQKINLDLNFKFGQYGYMALTNKEIKAIKNFAYNIKNSGMNPWGNQKRGKDVKELHMGKSKKSVFNKEDAVMTPKLEKIQKNNRR